MSDDATRHSIPFLFGELAGQRWEKKKGGPVSTKSGEREREREREIRIDNQEDTHISLSSVSLT